MHKACDFDPPILGLSLGNADMGEDEHIGRCRYFRQVLMRCERYAPNELGEGMGS